MMPITTFSEIRIKIYSTDSGIRTISSPIKIKILDYMHGEISEAEIVKQIGKSKSTVSVHLRSLIDDGVVSFKSHPLDRRSKLFYVVAELIGEIYPDRIIYQTPTLESDINTPDIFFKELFGQFKSQLLYSGLHLEKLEIESGKTMGKKLYEDFQYDSLEELTDLIKNKFEELKLGKIKIASLDPLIFKNTECAECIHVQYNLPTCNVIRGILIGILEEHFHKEVSIEEVECTSKFDDSCTFVVDY